MRNRLVASTAVLAVMLIAAPGATLAQSASFVVVHGISGRDVGSGVDPLLPVDVLVNGQLCLIKGQTFGQITGPFDVPAGSYSIAVSLANPISPCSNAPVITGSATLAAGQFASIVAALSTAGSPTAEIYPVNVRPVGAGSQRFTAAHAADAPPVDVSVTARHGGPETASFRLAPGQERNLAVAARPAFDVKAAVNSATVIGPVEVVADPRSVVLVFAVGSAKSGSATLLTKVIPDVF